MVAIQRHDNKMWAIPGGMVDPGEKVNATLRREFMEEALDNFSIIYIEFTQFSYLIVRFLLQRTNKWLKNFLLRALKSIKVTLMTIATQTMLGLKL